MARVWARRKRLARRRIWFIALTRADTILALDANFLGDEPGHVRYARDFSDRRRVRKGTTQN